MAKGGRREFFTSLKKSFTQKTGRAVARPPYFLESDIFAKCFECESRACLTSCDEKIMLFDEEFGVVLDFSKRGCTFCDKCALACELDVLDIAHKKMKIETTQVYIDMIECISWNGVICYSCKDVCYDNAIDFLGMLRPTINQNCTNCGFCVGVCPTNAVKLKEVS